MHHCLKPMQVVQQTRLLYRMHLCVFLIRKHQLDYWEVHMQNQNGRLPISAHFQTPTGVFQPFFKRITKIMKAQLQTKPPVDKSKSAKAMENGQHGLTHPTDWDTPTSVLQRYMHDFVLINYKSLLVKCHCLYPCVLSAFIRISMLIQHTLNIEMSISTKIMVWFGSKLNIVSMSPYYLGTFLLTLKNTKASCINTACMLKTNLTNQ